MYNVCLFLRGTQIQYMLNFKDQGLAEKARDKLRDARTAWLKTGAAEEVRIKDDFKQCLDIVSSDIMSIFTENLKEAMEAKVQAQIAQGEFNEEFKKRREGDINLIRLFPANQAPGRMQ